MSKIKISSKELKAIIKLCNLLGKHNIRSKSIAMTVDYEADTLVFHPLIENVSVIIRSKATVEDWQGEFSFNMTMLDELTITANETELIHKGNFLQISSGTLKANLKAIIQRPKYVTPKAVLDETVLEISPKIMETITSYLSIPYSYIKSQKSQASIWLHSNNGKLCATSTDSFSVGEVETDYDIDDIDIKVYQYILDALYADKPEKVKIIVDGYTCFLSNGHSVICVAGLSSSNQPMSSIYSKQAWVAGCTVEGKHLHAAAKQIISSLSSKDKMNSYISMTFEPTKVYLSLKHKTLGDISIEEIPSSSNIVLYNSNATSFVVHLHPQAFQDYTAMLNDKKMIMNIQTNYNVIYFETTVNDCKIKYLFPTVQL